MIWAIMLILLIVLVLVPRPDYQQNPEAVIPKSAAESVNARVATAEELNMSIADLGKRKLAKRLYLLDAEQSFSGALAWWHDGQEERFSYLAGPGERWSYSSIALFRALSLNKVYIISYEGDGDIAQRLTNLPQPYEDIPEGWTLLNRQ